MSNFLIPQGGRRSHGMTEEDWKALACAYDTWNNHIAVCEDLLSVVDPDLKEYVKSVFEAYDLWDYYNEEPMLEAYRQLVMIRC